MLCLNKELIGLAAQEYDLNGNATVSNASSGSPPRELDYTWDNQMRSGSLEDDLMNVRYDPMGHRIFKESSADGGQTFSGRKYVVDDTGELSHILLEIDPNDCCIRKTYVHANGQVLIQFDGDNTADKYFYLHDRLGSVRALMDTSGDVVNCYFYTPFGSVTSQESQETVNNWYGFAGYYADDVPVQRIKTA